MCAFLIPGCPLILTDMDVVEKIDSLSKVEKEFICTLLFHTINWFREVTAHGKVIQGSWGVHLISGYGWIGICLSQLTLDRKWGTPRTGHQLEGIRRQTICTCGQFKIFHEPYMHVFQIGKEAVVPEEKSWDLNPKPQACEANELTTGSPCFCLLST